MNVLLANPPWPDPNHPDHWGVRAGSRWPHFQRRAATGELPRYVPFPFFLAIAAGELRKAGHHTTLIDSVAENMSMEDFLDHAAAVDPDLIFIETSTPSLDNDGKILRELRERAPKAMIVAGGAHAPNLAAEWMDRSGLADAWIAGEYEWSLVELANRLDNGESIGDVPGTIVKGGTFSDFARVEDVNALAAPLFEALPMRNYSDPVCGLPSPTGNSWLSRGCPFKCSFCVWPQVIYGDRTYRRRRLDIALDEVETLINDFGSESFYFDDDTANLGEERMRNLADAIVERGLDQYPWAMMARADQMSEPMIESLARAGMYSIKYGVESVSPDLIKSCDKDTNLERFNQAIAATQRLGIKTHLTFTFGIPGETVDTMLETAEFAEKTAPETAQFSICTPFPGTRFFDDCLRNGWLVTRDWNRFLGGGDAVVNTPTLSETKLMETFETIEKRWRRFVKDRLEKRKKNLTCRLRKEVARGATWRFLGDRDFADFILSDETLTITLVEGQRQADLTVIVSRHDEEKLRRRLLRGDEATPAAILTLFID